VAGFSRPVVVAAVSAIGSSSCASTPCVQPRRKAMDGVCVANTSTSRSGRLAAIISVALAKRVLWRNPA
jgi:hypothetical protein